MVKKTASTQVLETEKQNKFNSFDEFKEFVETAFIEGSGIDPQLFKHCIEFHESLEILPGNEPTTPIHEALNWHFTRFGKQVKETLYAAFFKNEDGSIWQAVLSLWDEERQRPYLYRAPNDNGDRVFLPPSPPQLENELHHATV